MSGVIFCLAMSGSNKIYVNLRSIALICSTGLSGKKETYITYLEVTAMNR